MTAWWPQMIALSIIGLGCLYVLREPLAQARIRWAQAKNDRLKTILLTADERSLRQALGQVRGSSDELCLEHKQLQSWADHSHAVA